MRFRPFAGPTAKGTLIYTNLRLKSGRPPKRRPPALFSRWDKARRLPSPVDPRPVRAVDAQEQVEPALPRGQPVGLKRILVLWSLGLEQQFQRAVRIICNRSAVVDAVAVQMQQTRGPVSGAARLSRLSCAAAQRRRRMQRNAPTRAKANPRRAASPLKGLAAVVENQAFLFNRSATPRASANPLTPASPLKGLAASVRGYTFLLSRNAPTRASASPLTPASPACVEARQRCRAIDISGPKVYGLPYRLASRG